MWRRTLACVCLMALIWSCGGCDPITIDPTCPTETLRVGETAGLLANPTNPGAIPSYTWQVKPSTAGTFTDATAANTTFQALHEGVAHIILTAGDGLYQAVATCTINIEGIIGLAVSLEAYPTAAQTGNVVMLTCSSVGEDEVTQFSFTRIEGPEVELTELDEGIATFIAPEELGDLAFRCVGADEAGNLTDAALVSIRISPAPSDNENQNENANDNTNDNENTNDNSNDNENQNDNSNP